jgi:two-component sensor histidine kinase/ABC-type amino acid transport substrate-binding protein
MEKGSRSEKSYITPHAPSAAKRSAALLDRGKALVVICVILFLRPWAQLAAEERIVRVGVFPAAPLVFSKDGKPQGLFVDLVEYFAHQLGWSIRYVPGTWSEQLRRLEKNEIDLLPAVGYTIARTAIYDFSKNPVYIDSGVLFTNPKMALHTIFDLKGKRVAALRGSMFTAVFIDYTASFGIDCDMVLTEDNGAVMKAIADGEVDAGVCIYSLGIELAKQYPVAITPISFSPIALEFAVPKGKNGDLIAGIDRLMPGMINDPRSLYSQSFAKWTIPQQPFRIPAWLWWGMASFLALGVILSSAALVLKRQVRLKTDYLRIEIQEHKKTELALTKSLEEKEILLRELYHRTKNTLQLVDGFISLEALNFPSTPEIGQLVKKTGERIQAVALVHEMLYKSQNLSEIPIKEYITELISLIFKSFGSLDDRISVELAIDDHAVLLDTAIPFGLILNELLTNSLQHAFPGQRKGLISIRIANEGEKGIIMDYRDDGIGVPDGFDFNEDRTFGLRLIRSIGESQLGGSVAFTNGRGVRCLVRASTDLYTARV